MSMRRFIGMIAGLAALCASPFRRFNRKAKQQQEKFIQPLHKQKASDMPLFFPSATSFVTRSRRTFVHSKQEQRKERKARHIRRLKAHRTKARQRARGGKCYA